MKEKRKAVGGFALGWAKLIFICVVVFYYFRGLNWIFEKTLLKNREDDFPPIVLSIFVTSIIVLIVIRVWERPTRKLVKEEKKRAVANEQAVIPLRMALRLNENKEAPFRAASELAKIGSPQAVKVLCEALVDSEADLRTFVWNTLVSMGDTAVGEIGLMLWNNRDEQHKQARFYAASALGKIGSHRAVEELCSALTWIDSEGNVLAEAALRACLSNTLVNIGSPAVEELCLKLNQKDCIRAYAAIALGEIGDGRAVEPLRKRLRRIDNLVQRLVSWAFGEKLNFGYGVRRTAWEWETDSLRTALVKCGCLPTMTNSSTVQNSTNMKKNIKTKILIAALAAFILTCLFPPWLNVLDVPYHAHQRTPAGHEFILFPPDSKGGAWSVEIDLKMFFVEWVALAAVTGMVWVLVVKPAWSRDGKTNRPQTFIPPPGNPEN